MVRYDTDYDLKERYEYHGHTTVERIRLRSGAVVSRDWIMFDSVQEAEDYFNAFDDSAQPGGRHVWPLH
jgi:hypothetical protein